MPRFARYVLREVLPLYAAGVVVFVVLMTTDLISSVAGIMLRNATPLDLALQVYATQLPNIIGRALPLAVPFAILIALGRLAHDSELKALLAGGVRPVAVLWPLVILGVLIGAVGFYNSNVLIPAGNARFDVVWTKVWYNAPPSPPREFRYTHREGANLFYAGSVQPLPNDPTRATLNGVLVQTPEATYSAQSGVWDAEKRTWELTGVWTVSGQDAPRFDVTARTFAQGDRLRQPSRPPQQLALAALQERAADPTLEVRERREFRFELARRFADPLTALGFALAAGALGLLVRNRAWGFASIVLLIFGFYVVWSAMPQMVKVGALPEMLAAWLPNVLLVLLAVAVMWRLR